MNTADHTNFVSVLSEEKPVMVFFHRLSDATYAKKIKIELDSISKELPLLPLYEFVIDDNTENENLSEHIGVAKTPILIFFKHGNFHRFKIKGFTKPSILEFIGHKKPYKLPETSKELSDMNEKTDIKTPKKKSI